MDVKAYKYSFSKRDIIADCQNVFCYTMAKSIVDHTKMKKDELVYFVSKMCKKGDAEVSLDMVRSFLEELISIWNLLDSEIAPSFKGGRFLSVNANGNAVPDSKLSMESFKGIFEK